MDSTPLVMLRRQLIRYAYERITLAEFERRVMELGSAITEEDRRGSNLAAAIEAHLAQHAAGRWTESELRLILRLLADEESQKRRRRRRGLVKGR